MAYSVLSLKLRIPDRRFNDDYLERTLDPIAPPLHKMWLEIASQTRTRDAIGLKLFSADRLDDRVL
jgi:hypothetical protein